MEEHVAINEVMDERFALGLNNSLLIAHRDD